MKKIAQRLVALALISFLPACAITEDIIEVRHTPSFGAQELPGAANIVVQVISRDDRNTNRHRVSVKKNGYGMEMASIVASNDVVSEVGKVVETTLQSMGFRTGPAGDRNVIVELHKFWNDFKLGFWSGQAVAELAAKLTVRDATGRILYSRMYSVEAVIPEVMIMTGENARLALVQSLDRLAQRIRADGELSQALLDRGQDRRAAPPPTPSASRRERPTS